MIVTPTKATFNHRCFNKSINGFTLLELLVVLVVMGIMLGLVTLNAIPSKEQSLQRDVQRVALLLQLAREEAIVRNTPVAFELDNEGYRFLVRGQTEWKPLFGNAGGIASESESDSDLFRPRTFKNSPITIAMNPSPPQEGLPMRIIFGREPVDRPFTLTLGYQGAFASIHADGIGHFTVQ